MFKITEKKMGKISKIKIKLLKKYFLENPEISMAFLFGSRVKGQVLFDSDVDIAVYFKPGDRRLEWEERGSYPGVTEIWAETEKILGENVDILVLNKAPCLIASGKKPLPGTYREILRSFMSLKNFDKNVAEKLGEFARLRNIITHEYLDIRWEQMQHFLKTARPLFEHTIEYVKKHFLL